MAVKKIKNHSGPTFVASLSICTLACLVFSKFGDEGAHILADFLPTDTVHTELHLDECGFGDDGGRAIFEALKTNTSLTKFTIYSDKTKVCGFIVKLINFVLVCVCVDNPLHDDTIHVLAEALKCNTTLTYLDVSCNSYPKFL